MGARALVIGLGQATEPAVRQLLARGYDVVVLQDTPNDVACERASRLGVELVSDIDVETLVRSAEVVAPSPSVVFGHPAIQRALQTGVPVWSEFELFEQWDHRPCVAITGTNGKTTVTTLVELMMRRAGRHVVSCGNNELPLVEAIADPAVEVFVVEASSFRLEFTDSFRPVVGTWLNLTPDHLDWHPTVEHYADAKFKLWAKQREHDVAIANADDPVVMRYLERAPARHVTFGFDRGDYRVRDGHLVAAAGEVISAVSDLPRALPHDLSNALAAAATAIEAGASAEACGDVLRSFRGLPHRVAFIRDTGGVQWYDDSKATTPASVVAAVGGFDSVVLVAGGRNKGLDLGVLRSVAARLRAVVAIGEAAPLIEDVFRGLVPVTTATSMGDAVARARELAQPGDAVLLSPGCASYDWYRNYGERGDHFARLVNDLDPA